MPPLVYNVPATPLVTGLAVVRRPKLVAVPFVALPAKPPPTPSGATESVELYALQPVVVVEVGDVLGERASPVDLGRAQLRLPLVGVRTTVHGPDGRAGDALPGQRPREPPLARGPGRRALDRAFRARCEVQAEHREE